MSRPHLLDFAGLFLLFAACACAAQEASAPDFSSSAELISAPNAAPSTPTPDRKIHTWRPFSAVAIALKIGTGGVGPEIATPLNRHLNLRGSFQVFDHKLNFRTSGIYSQADLTIQNAAIMLDYFPLGGGFHISPGVTVYGDNHLTSNLTVPGGSTFLLGPDGYTSDPNDPVTGIGRVKFGNPVSPRLTIGWGNLLPRSGRHFAVPFELGFQYTSPPTVQIALNGSVCDPDNNCGSVNSGTAPQSLQSEISELNGDLQPLRFYPIIAIGFSYRIGH